MEAARRIPGQPNANSPSWGGMNGVQLPGSTAPAPTAITTAITVTFTTTRNALTPADWRTPAQSTVVTAAIASTAMTFSEKGPVEPTSGVARYAGRTTPKLRSRLAR